MGGVRGPCEKGEGSKQKQTTVSSLLEGNGHGRRQERVCGSEWWWRVTWPGVVSRVYRWCVIELNTLSLYNFINQCHPHKFNLKRLKIGRVILPTLFSQVCFSYSRTCAFHMCFRTSLSMSTKTSCWNLDSISWKL